ncbi:MAG: flavin reductase [Rhodospirillaceae bacterium]
MTREDFLEGMSRAAQTVSVVTTDGPAGRAGVTVSAMCSVSADPPMVLACIHHQSRAVPTIRQNAVFCVNVLADTMREVSNIFAAPAPVEEMFAAGAWNAGGTGAPMLAGALAAFDCRVEEIHRAGSHFIFIGTVAETRLGEGAPLIYGARRYGRPDFFTD